jgi:hypothetical protein
MPFTQLQPVTAISATGGGTDAPFSGLTGFGQVNLSSLNTAGTTPTLAAKLQHSAAPVLGYNQLVVGTTQNKIKAGASTTVEVGAKITKSGASSIKSVSCMLQQNGAVSQSATLAMTIYADSAGAPGTSLGVSANVLVSAIPTAYGYVTFTFATPIDLADATIYHFVLIASYTASSTANVTWQSNTVGSGGTLETFDGTSTWTATATEALEMFTSDYVFTDVTGGGFTGATTGAANQSLGFYHNITFKAFVRLYFTIGGTASPNYYVSALYDGKKVTTP